MRNHAAKQENSISRKPNSIGPLPAVNPPKGRNLGAAAEVAAVTVTVTLPDPVTLPGTEQLTLARVLATEHENVTLPLKLLTALTATDEVAEAPGATLTVDGVSVRLKSEPHSDARAFTSIEPSPVTWS
jgi:hypothetical protein